MIKSINFLTQLLRMTMLLMINILLVMGIYVAYIYLQWFIAFKGLMGM